MKHLILLTVESLRADVFQGVWAAPNLNRFASDGLLFTECHSVGVNTAVGQAGILTGRYPPNSGARLHFPICLRAPSLAEILKKHGFHTIASAQFANDLMNAGLLQSFAARMPSPAQAFRETLRARKRRQRTFLLIQSGALHARYGAGSARALPYAQRIQEFDSEFFQKTWKEIVRMGLDQDTLIALVGAHGEGISGERGYYGHGASLDEAAIRVPWVLRGRGIARGRSSELVSTVDVAPTCLAFLLNKASRSTAFQGRVRAPRTEAKSECPAYAELWSYDPLYWRRLRLGISTGNTADRSWTVRRENFRRLCRLQEQTLRQGRYKWVVRYDAKGREKEEALYDLESDPGEYCNLLLEGRGSLAEARRMARSLKRKLRRLGAGPEPRAETGPSELFLPLHSQDGARLEHRP